MLLEIVLYVNLAFSLVSALHCPVNVSIAVMLYCSRDVQCFYILIKCFNNEN